jgi:hypothetical protein
MLSPKAYLKQGMPESHEIWVNALEMVEHCLQGDCKQSFFKDGSPSINRFHEWSAGMQNRAQWDGKFQELFENNYRPIPKWTRYDDDSGDLMVDRYISGEELCFDAYERKARQKQAISVIYDGNVCWGDRHETYMVERHRKVYEIAAQCEAERRPCRVIVIMNDLIPEVKNDTLKMFLVVKDYNDPIFPAIWGTFVNNLYTNAFANVIMDYFVGTYDSGNGRPIELHKIRSFFPDDEELIMFGRDLIDD